MTAIVTPEFRGNFVSVLEPKEDLSGRMKYSIAMTFPKDDPFWDKLQEKMDQACVEKWGKAVKYIHHIKSTDAKEYYPDGHKAFTASNLKKPEVLVREEDGTLREPISPDEIYSGAIYKAQIRCYGSENSGKGVFFSLDNLLKVRDGDKIGMKKESAADVDWD